MAASYIEQITIREPTRYHIICPECGYEGDDEIPGQMRRIVEGGSSLYWTCPGCSNQHAYSYDLYHPTTFDTVGTVV